MDANEYYLAGVTIAVSIVHGGPAPCFLAKPLFDALLIGPDKVDVMLDSMPQCQAKHDLQIVC